MPNGRELAQHERREFALFTDQFGREWGAVIDVIARGACSAINPHNFTDRLQVPQKYLMADTVRRKLDVQLQRYLEDLEYGHKVYNDQLMDDAFQLFGDKAPQAIEERSPALLRLTGEPPQPTAPVKAAIAGNKYVLGLSDNMPDWAKPYFLAKPKPVEQFPDAEDYLDLEDEVDPEAVGGKKQNPRKNNTRISEAA